MKHYMLALAAVLVMGCGVHNQKKGINDARMALATMGMAVTAADEVVAKTYETAPPEDTDAYCKNKIASIILTQATLSLRGAAESVLLWEEALAVYLARKDAGTDTAFDWDDVLSSEAEWLKLAGQSLAILAYVRPTLKLWLGEKFPDELDYAWRFVTGLSGVESVDVEMDWDDLKGSVCIDYLPGGE